MLEILTDAGWEWGPCKGDGATEAGLPTELTIMLSWVRGYDGGPPWGV